MWAIVVLGVLAGVASYMMTPEEKTRALTALRTAAIRLPETIRGGPSTRPFANALAERTRWPFVTPLIGLAFIVYYVFALGSSSDQTLIALGANIGPKTTNGGWHRLLMATFVHASFFSLLASLAGLAAVGIIAERLVGSFAFAAVFVSAALAASFVSLAIDPLGLSAGATGALLGVFGLMLGAAGRVFLVTRTPLMPFESAKPLAPLAGFFLLHALAAARMPFKAELASLVTGIIAGFVLSGGLKEGKPPVKRVGRVLATAGAIALVCAVLLRGLDDGRPEIASIAELEKRIAGEYDAQIGRYRAGNSSGEQLIRMIQQTFVPELQAAQDRLEQLDRVPNDQRTSLDRANEYLHQRQESWRLRVDGLRHRAVLEARQSGRNRPVSDTRRPSQLLESSAAALRDAETAERNALAALNQATEILH
jgi:rhomboid protease GluP